MSATSSGSDKRDNGSSRAMGSSTKEAGEVTEGNVCNACNNQSHSTTHCTQCKTNPNLTGESDMSTPAQAQSKGETSKNDGKLTDDNEKGEKSNITPREQDKNVHDAMQRAQNYQGENFCAEKGKVLLDTNVAAQCGQCNENRNIEANDVSRESFEKNGKDMVAEAATDADHKIDTEEQTSSENNKQMDQGDEMNSASQKQTLDQRYRKLSNPESVNLKREDSTPTPQTENLNQGNSQPSSSQTVNAKQGDGKSTTSHTESSNQGDGKQTTSLTVNAKQGVGKKTTSLTENANQGDGKSTTSSIENANQGDGKSTTSHTESSKQGDGKQTTSLTENANQGDGKQTTTLTENGQPSSSQTDDPNQGVGKSTTSHTDSSNQGDGKQTTSLTVNANQGDGKQTTTLTENANQGDGKSTTSSIENANQENGMPSLPQAKILNPGNGISSAMGDKIHVNISKGTADNTEKVKNDKTSELDAGNLHKSDGNCERATTEEEGQYAIAKTQQPQCSNQVTEYASGQIEEGATWSEHPQIPFSFSQSQADLTPIENQLEQIIDKVLTEDKEELKENLKKEVMVFFLTIVKDGTLLRSFHPNVSHNMPAHNFYIDFAEKGMDEERTRRSLPNTPMSRSDTARSKSQRSRSPSMSNLELSQGHERDKSNPHVQPHGKKTSTPPDPPIGGTPFSKSCLPAISADGNSRSSSLEEKPGDVLKVAEEKSLGKKTSNATDPPIGGTPFSKSCLPGISTPRRATDCPSSTSQIDMEFKKNVEGVRTESLRSTAGSSQRPTSEDPDNLYIQWNTEPNTEGNNNFEIHVLCSHSSKTITNIQIVCKPADFYRLKFLFDKKSKDLQNNLSAMEYTVDIRDQEIFIGNGTARNPELIRNDIEAAIIRMKDFSRTVVHYALTSFADERLVEKCEVLSSECKKGNIAMYLDHLSVWIVGRDGDEVKILETKLMEKRFLQKEHILDLTENLYFTEDHEGMQNENTIPLDYPSGMPFVESHFASDTALSQREDKKEVWKHDYSFVVEAEKRLKEEEWELQVECSPTEYLKLLFIFSNDTLKMKAKEKLNSFQIILHEGYSMRLKTTCMCMKPEGHTKLDGLFIDDVLSAFKSLFPLVHLTKIVMDQSTGFEEIENYCHANHDACKKNLVHLFYNEKMRDEIWVAVEHGLQHFGNEVVKDLLSKKLATKCPLEQENYNLIGYFVQSAALKDKDLRLFGLLKENKYLAEKYQGMNVYGNDKWVVFSGQKEIHKYLFEKVAVQSWSVSPTLKELLNNHEVVEFINETIQAKHPNEPMIWMVAEHSEKSILEMFALHNSSAICGMKTVQKCFVERCFDDDYLQKEAFQFQGLKGEKFKGKIKITYLKTFVKITGTVDVFEEFIALLLKESDRLKKPVCKTVKVKNRNIFNFLETHHQDNFRKWRKSVDISAVVKDEKCGYAIKSSAANSDKIVEIREELEMILSDITEITVVDEKIQLDLTGNREFRRQRCDIEKEWNVDIIIEGIPGQDWSEEDGIEWHFQNGQSFTILTLKSALPVETDVVLHPYPKANIKVGTHQTNTDDFSNRDWHYLKFEVEHKDIGKAKDTLRESLKTTLLTKVKGTQFQNIVFPLDQKTMERIGWSIIHYLKQILYAVHEGCGLEPWTIFFLCATKDEFEACVKILKKHFEDSKSSMSSLKIKTFPIQENLTPAMTIEIKQGSLVETEADVIVNTTDKSLRRLQSGQISKSILFAAGDELSKECVKKYSKGVGYSEVAVTPSFQLKLCKKIYHGGIPTYNGTLEPLTKFVWNCLLQATKDKMKSIAFPAIGTGNLMYPIESVADAMMSTVEKFRDEQSTTLISVFFVIFDTGTLQKFRERNSSKQAAAGTETPSMKITVIGNSDGAENASLCLREFINDLKKKKEDVNVTKPAELQQPTLEGNKGQGKSKEIVDDQRRTILSETIHKRENISDDRISLGLILVKKALDTDSSLDAEECRRHLNEFKYKNIICPFGKKFQALVKFETMEDTDRVLKNFKSASFKIEKLPHQAVNNIKAKLSREIVNYLKASDFQEEEVENETGAHLDKNEWIITGTLLEIKQAEEFLRMKICKNAESKGQNSNTCLPKGIPDASAVDASAKKTLRCSISDWEAVKFFFKDVISKFYSKPDLDDSCCVVSGNQEAINEFSHSLKSLFKRTLTNIGQDDLKLGTKSKSVYYYFAKKENRLIMYAKSEEILKAAEELFKSQARKGERRSDEVLDEENQNLPQKTYPSTTDNNDALNDEYYEMEADDFNTVCHFYKELTTGFKERCVGSKVHLKGPKDQVENLKFALQEITQKFYTVEIERDGREQSKIYDIYAQMMQVEHSIHTRVKMRGSKIAVLFTGKEKESVADLKSWFEVELKNKTKTSGKKMATYQKKSSLYENCLIFEEKQLKVYAIEKDILEVSSAAIVCPYPLHVGQYIRKKLGVESGIADYIGLLGLDEIKVIPVDTSSSKLTLLHTSVPYWTKYYKKDNPSDDCIQDIQSIIENCLSAGEIYKTLSIPVFYSDRLCHLPDMIWCTAVERALRNYSKIRKGSNEMNIYMVDKKPEKIQALKRFFTEGINWSFVSNETFSVFYFGSTFQLHVKKADIFGAEADALAVPQDPGMKNERFIAKQLSKLEDKSYQSAIKSLKSFKLPTVTVAPFQLCFSKVIHYVSPNWNNRNKKREALLKDHYLSMKTLLDAASSHCASVVIPLSGGQNTNEETRKEIAKSTATAVADWFKENSKKLNILKTIYFENDDTKNIKFLIECFERKLQPSCFVERPKLSSAV